MYLTRILLCLVASVLAHALAVQALERLPEEQKQRRPQTVTVRIVNPPPPAPEPPPEPPPPPPPPPPPTPTIVHEVPTEQPVQRRSHVPPPPSQDAVPKNTPPSERAVTSGPSTTTPTFGFSLESTSESGSGPAMPVGNTLQVPQTGPAVAPAKVKPLAAPVPVYEVTKMPTMRDRCRGEYTDAARDAGVEGTVVLDLVVDEEGNTRDIKVVHGLGHGLDEAAVAALKRCRFAPGERGGSAVPVRVREFKIRFFLQDDT